MKVVESREIPFDSLLHKNSDIQGIEKKYKTLSLNSDFVT